MKRSLLLVAFLLGALLVPVARPSPARAAGDLTTYPWDSTIMLPDLLDLELGTTRTFSVSELQDTPFTGMTVTGAADDSFGIGWFNPILNLAPSEHVEMTLTWEVNASGEFERRDRFGRPGLSVNASAELTGGAALTATLVLPKAAYEEIRARREPQPMPFAPGTWPVGTMMKGDYAFTGTLTGEGRISAFRTEMGISATRGIALGAVRVDEDTVRFFAGPEEYLGVHLGLGAGVAGIGALWGTEWGRRDLYARFVDWNMDPGLRMDSATLDRLWNGLLALDLGVLGLERSGKLVINHTSATNSFQFDVNSALSWDESIELSDSNSRVLRIDYDARGSTPASHEFERFAVNEQGLGYLYQEMGTPGCAAKHNNLFQLNPYPGLAGTYRHAFDDLATVQPAEPAAISLRMSREGLQQLKDANQQAGDATMMDFVNTRQSIGQLYAGLVNGNYHHDRFADHFDTIQHLRGERYDFPGIKITYGAPTWAELKPCVPKQQYARDGVFYHRIHDGSDWTEFEALPTSAKVYLGEADPDFRAFNSFVHPDTGEIVQQLFVGDTAYHRRRSDIGWSDFTALKSSASVYDKLDSGDSFTGFNVYVDPNNNQITQELVITNSAGSSRVYERTRSAADGWSGFTDIDPELRHPIYENTGSGTITGINTYQNPVENRLEQVIVRGGQIHKRVTKSDGAWESFRLQDTFLSAGTGGQQAFNERVLPG